MINYNKHGFIYDSNDTPDYILMAVTKREAARRAQEMSHVDYLRWKNDKLTEALRQRVADNDQGSYANSRIIYTKKAISYIEKQLKQLEI